MATVRIPRSEIVRPIAPEESRPGEEAERRRHLRVVGPRERFRPQNLRITPRLGMALVVLLFVALFAVAASHALLITGQGELDRLDQQVADETARHEALRAEVATRGSASNIVAAAEDLGMQSAADIDWLTPTQPIAHTGTGSEDGAGEATDPGYPEIKPHLNPSP